MFYFSIQSIKMKLFPRRFFRQYLPLLLLYGDTFWFQVPSETLLYQIQDPLSVVLSLTGEEEEEERVDISINEMLEEYVWSKD